MSDVVKIDNVWFSYDDTTVLEDVSLSVSAHTFLGILGPNGAGKTTLVKLVLGLLEPTRGTVRVFGRDPHEVGEHIGYVPQHSLYDITFPITVLEVVLMGRLSGRGLMRRYGGKDIQAALKALDTVEMGEFKDRQIGALSTGQRQRVLLARALMGSPGLLILDEPLTGIDICLEFEIYELLKRLKHDMAIILISHDVGVVSQHVDSIACLNKRIFCHDDKESALKNLERVYGCPVDIIAHGVPHRVLRKHDQDGNPQI